MNIIRIQGDLLHEPSRSDLTQLVYECEDLYTGIDMWFKRKVVPGLLDRSRVAFVAYEKEKAIGCAILKISENAKLCSLRVRPQFSGRGIGTALFGLAAKEILSVSQHLHFTAPEALVATQGQFFRHLGFEACESLQRKYRPGQDELAFCGRTEEIVRRTRTFVRADLFGAEIRADADAAPWLILSIRPKFAERILRGEKTLEIRRRFTPTLAGRRLLIYSSAPTQALVATARIGRITQIESEAVDDVMLQNAGCTHEEFTQYIGDAQRFWTVALIDIKPLASSVTLSHVRSVLNEPIHPPMSYGIAGAGTPWGRVAEYLALVGATQTL